MGTKVRVKQWGNSLGVILPKELVEKRDLKKGGEILIEIVNPTQFNKIFGSLKLKRSTEELMKIAREGWK
tara:strand:- start:12798 stop:13007 length:210 start_codon:yes stop_codon:yes gene_type:complete